MRTAAVRLCVAGVVACAAPCAHAVDPHANPAATPAAARRLRIGQTQSTVLGLLGHDYARCSACGPHLVWLYDFRDELGVGVAVTFIHGRVSAVVPLGV